jgi:cytochrome c
MSRILSAVSLLLLSACATSFVPASNSATELMRYVDKAARVVQAEGPSACAAFHQPKWKSGEFYIFVTSADSNITVCHPVRDDLVGQDQTDLQDANGRFFIREMLAIANSPAGRGWVDYAWARPGETTATKKSAYVVEVVGPGGKRYVVGSGAYGVVH